LAADLYRRLHIVRRAQWAKEVGSGMIAMVLRGWPGTG